MFTFLFRPASPRAFIVTLLGIVGLGLGVVGIMNYVTDPYGIFGVNSGPYYFSSEREIKLGQRSSITGRGIVMGSSKATEIDPVLTDHPDMYNSAWSAARPEEMADYLRNGGFEAQPSFVVLGLDFFMFNANRHSWVFESRFQLFDPIRTLRHLFSLEIAKKSILLLLGHYADFRPTITARGTRNMLDLEAGDRTRALPEMDLNELAISLYADFRFSTERLQIMEGVLNEAHRYCIPLIVFINPISKPLIAKIESMGLEEEWREFRRQVMALTPASVDLSEGVYSDPTDFWRDDPFHYYPGTGAAFYRDALAPIISAAISKTRDCSPTM